MTRTTILFEVIPIVLGVAIVCWLGWHILQRLVQNRRRPR